MQNEEVEGERRSEGDEGNFSKVWEDSKQP